MAVSVIDSLSVSPGDPYRSTPMAPRRNIWALSLGGVWSYREILVPPPIANTPLRHVGGELATKGCRATPFKWM